MKNNKSLVIKLVDEDTYFFRRDCNINYLEESGKLTYLCSNDYDHIYLNHKISDEELDKALRIIMTKFMQDKMNTIHVKLDEFDKGLAPAKEMTIEEIEKELGYKVKVVGKTEGKK